MHYLYIYTTSRYKHNSVLQLIVQRLQARGTSLYKTPGIGQTGGRIKFSTEKKEHRNHIHVCRSAKVNQTRQDKSNIWHKLLRVYKLFNISATNKILCLPGVLFWSRDTSNMYVVLQ